MLEAVPLLATTLLFIGVFIQAYATLQIDDIRRNWNERRCEPFVMAMAQLVPTDPNIDPSDFSIDNFKFCIGNIIQSSIAIFFSPVLKLFSKQMDLTKPINSSLNHLRDMAATLMKPLQDMLNTLWNKFSFIIYQAARIFMKLHSVMDRIFGILTASLFAGMAMYKGIQNAIGFVIQVVIAILIILCILVIFLYFVMWPVIPIILTIIGILSTTIYAANVSGMSGSFCVGPATQVMTKDGWRRVDTLEVGQELDEGVVEGILKTVSGGGLVKIDNVIISKTHLIQINNEWIPANHHPLATPLTDYNGFLYCLNTSTHNWKVKLRTGELVLRDWEELPDGYDKEWESIINNMFNEEPSKSNDNDGRGLIGPLSCVEKFGEGGYLKTYIGEINIGDIIRSGKNTTRVLGIYKDSSCLVPSSGPNKSSWILHNGKWIHPTIVSPVLKVCGYHLITDSGTFNIAFVGGEALMRDFTEVGSDRIDETYPFTLKCLVKNRNA